MFLLNMNVVVFIFLSGHKEEIEKGTVETLLLYLFMSIYSEVDGVECSA